MTGVSPFICSRIFLNSHVRKVQFPSPLDSAYQGTMEKFDQKTARIVMEVRA